MRNLLGKVNNSRGMSNLAVIGVGLVGIVMLKGLVSQVGQYTSTAGAQQASFADKQFNKLVGYQIQKKIMSGEWTYTLPLASVTAKPFWKYVGSSNPLPYVPLFVADGTIANGKCVALPSGNAPYLSANPLGACWVGASVGMPAPLQVSPDAGGDGALLQSTSLTGGVQYVVVTVPNITEAKRSVSSGRSLYSPGEKFPVAANTLIPALVSLDGYVFGKGTSQNPTDVKVTIYNRNVTSMIVPLNPPLTVANLPTTTTSTTTTPPQPVTCCLTAGYKGINKSGGNSTSCPNFLGQSISLNADSQDPFQLQWSSTNASSCTLSAQAVTADNGDPTYPQPWTLGPSASPNQNVSGTMTISGPKYWDIKYALVCSNATSSSSANLTVRRYAWGAGGPAGVKFAYMSEGQARSCYNTISRNSDPNCASSARWGSFKTDPQYFVPTALRSTWTVPPFAEFPSGNCACHSTSFQSSSYWQLQSAPPP